MTNENITRNQIDLYKRLNKNKFFCDLVLSVLFYTEVFSQLLEMNLAKLFTPVGNNAVTNAAPDSTADAASRPRHRTTNSHYASCGPTTGRTLLTYIRSMPIDICFFLDDHDMNVKNNVYVLIVHNYKFCRYQQIFEMFNECSMIVIAKTMIRSLILSDLHLAALHKNNCYHNF